MVLLTMNTVLALVVLAAINSIAAEELNVPRVLFSRLSRCAGEDLRISCSDDGEPFIEYKIDLVEVKLYASASEKKSCKTNSRFPAADADLCIKDYKSGEFGGMAELGNQISIQCVNQRECFIRLPTARQLHSKHVCGDKAYFYGIEIEYQCTAPAWKHTGFGTTKNLGSKQAPPQIFRRRRSTSSQNHNSKERGTTDRKSIEIDNVKSTDTNSHGTSKNNNNLDTSRNRASKWDKSRNQDNSRDRTGGDDWDSSHQGNEGRRTDRKANSFTKDGRSIYSDSNLQRSGSTNTVAMGTVIAIACLSLLSS